MAPRPGYGDVVLRDPQIHRVAREGSRVGGKPVDLELLPCSTSLWAVEGEGYPGCGGLSQGMAGTWIWVVF